MAVAASGKAREPTGFAGSNFRLDVISDCEHQPGPIPCTRELQGHDKEARFESWRAGRIGLGNGRGFVSGCRIQKGPHGAGFCIWLRGQDLAFLSRGVGFASLQAPDAG